MTTVAMHPALREPFAFCDAERARLMAIVRGLTRREWSLRRSPDEWSVALYVDHLIRAEVGTSKMATRLIRGDFAGVRRPKAARLYDSSLSEYPYGRYPAPTGLSPAPLAIEEAILKLEATHARFREELCRFDGPDPDAIASEDPDTGWWFTLAGWVRLQALHEAHHINQLQTLVTLP